MNTQRFTIKSQELISATQNLATNLGHQELTDLHLLSAMLEAEDSLLPPLLDKLELNRSRLQQDLQQALAAFVDYYNNHRYHESLNNLTPADVYSERSQQILDERQILTKNQISNQSYFLLTYVLFIDVELYGFDML